MRAMMYGALMFMVATCAAAPSSDRASIDPFAAAVLAPADVRLYLHVQDAASIRRRLASRPIADWFEAAFGSNECIEAWSALAKTDRMDEKRLFDAALGKRFTLLARDRTDWVLIAEPDRRFLESFMARLKPRPREPRAGVAVCELIEQGMLLAIDGSQVIVGPSRNPRLFDETLKAAHEGHAPDPLKAQPDWQQIAELGRGPVGLFMRHDPPLGGWSACVANLHADQVTIHHLGRFDHAPFNHGITKLTCDFSPVDALKDVALAAIMQPSDVTDGPVEAFLTANLGQGLISRDMRSNLGDRRLLVFCEADGRELGAANRDLPRMGLPRQPMDVLTTTVVVCLEVMDSEAAKEQLDTHMARVVGRLQQVSQGSMLAQAPQRYPSLQLQDQRRVDLDPVASCFTGGFPIMKPLTLTWSVAQGPHSGWFVVASHERSMNDVVRVLGQPQPSKSALCGQYDSCGVGNGVRIGHHLMSWSEAADQFSAPDEAADVRATLQTVSKLAAGVQKCEWQLARPSANEMRLKVHITLSPPLSSGE